MDAVLFEEREADKKIIASLIGTNRTLWEELEQKRLMLQSLQRLTTKRSYIDMFIKSVEGKFYRVEAEQEVSADEVQAALSHCQAEADALQALLAPAALADAPADPAAAPADQNPANDASAAPAAPEAPIAPEQPAEPVSDPNAAPAQPEQPQQATQPDPNELPPLQ